MLSKNFLFCPRPPFQLVSLAAPLNFVPPALEKDTIMLQELLNGHYVGDMTQGEGKADIAPQVNVSNHVAG